MTPRAGRGGGGGTVMLWRIVNWFRTSFCGHEWELLMTTSVIRPCDVDKPDAIPMKRIRAVCCKKCARVWRQEV